MYSMVGLAAANMKGQMVVDAHGDIVESSFVETTTTAETTAAPAVTTPADNGTPVTDSEAAQAAANSVGQAIVDMENQAQMQQQMDAYIRKKNAQLSSVQRRYDQVKAYYAMLDLHEKLVDTLIGRFQNLKGLIDERTEIEQRAVEAFIKIHNNLAQMNNIYASGQTDTLVAGPTVQMSTMRMVLQQIWGPILKLDDIYQLNGFLAETLYNVDQNAYSSMFANCWGTNSMDDMQNGQDCEMALLQETLSNTQGSQGDSSALSYQIAQMTNV